MESDWCAKFLALMVICISISDALPKRKLLRNDESPTKKDLLSEVVALNGKTCIYNDENLKHGRIGYEDICGALRCIDGFMQWYFWPNAPHFPQCHVPVPLLEKQGLADGNIPVFGTQGDGSNIVKLPIVGGPVHGYRGEGIECHDCPHHAMIQTTAIDITTDHHGHRNIQIHNPVQHDGNIRIEDFGGHHQHY